MTVMSFAVVAVLCRTSGHKRSEAKQRSRRGRRLHRGRRCLPSGASRGSRRSPRWWRQSLRAGELRGVATARGAWPVAGPLRDWTRMHVGTSRVRVRSCRRSWYSDATVDHLVVRTVEGAQSAQLGIVRECSRAGPGRGMSARSGERRRLLSSALAASLGCTEPLSVAKCRY